MTVAGKGMAGVHGIAARTFVAVDAERLSVSTIFQASSESSIGFTLPESEADRAVRRGQARVPGRAGERPDRQRRRRGRAWPSSPSSATAWSARPASRRACSRRSRRPASTSSRSRRDRRSATSRSSFASRTCREAVAPRSCGVSAVEDRRRPAARHAVHRRRPSRVRPCRSRARRSDRRRDRRTAASASSACSIGPGYVFEPTRIVGSTAARAGAREGRRRAALVAGRHAGVRGRRADVHGGPRRVASGRRGRHERRDDAAARRRTGPGLRRRAGEQEAGRRIVRKLRGADGAATAAGRRIKYEATVGAGLPDHRHVSEARRRPATACCGSKAPSAAR